MPWWPHGDNRWWPKLDSKAQAWLIAHNGEAVSPEVLSKIHYDYLCMSSTCTGHKPRILDMELSALQHRNRFKTDAELKAIITLKFHTEMWNERVRTYFFVGNFGDIIKRKNFSVLGIYRPPRAASYAASLF